MLARQLSIEEYGLIAIIFTVTQFFNIFSISITKEKLVQCDEADLEYYCQSSWLLQLICGFIIFFLQCFVGFFNGVVTSNHIIFFPIALAAVIHLLTPFTSVQLALLERQQNYKIFSRISDSVVIINNLFH